MNGGRPTDEFGSGVVVDGRYRVVEDHAAGVWEGVHLATGRQVRLSTAPGDTTAMMRLKRLLPTVVALDHPALIPVLDVGFDERGLYLVEPRVEGELLSELVGEPQATDRVVDIVRQLARVLADAHARGIVHGALRPECVVLQQTLGRSDYVRLRGLGLGGTPFDAGPGAWAAPETVAGRAPDARVDLYALGLIGRALLGGLGPEEAAAGPLPGAPPGLVEVFDALVRRSPGQRPPSAVAVLGPLERVSQGSFTGSMRPVARAMSDTLLAGSPDFEPVLVEPVAARARGEVFVAPEAPGHPGRAGREAAGFDADETVDVEPPRRVRAIAIAAAVGVLVALIGWWVARSPGGEATGDAAIGAEATDEAGAAATPQRITITTPPPADAPAAAPAPPHAAPDAAPDDPDAAPIDAPREPVGEPPAAETLRPRPPPRPRARPAPATPPADRSAPPPAQRDYEKL